MLSSLLIPYYYTPVPVAEPVIRLSRRARRKAKAAARAIAPPVVPVVARREEPVPPRPEVVRVPWTVPRIRLALPQLAPMGVPLLRVNYGLAATIDALLDIPIHEGRAPLRHVDVFADDEEAVMALLL